MLKKGANKKSENINDKKTNKKRTKILLSVFLCIVLAGFCAVLGINAYVKNTGEKYMLTQEEAAKLSDVDCILVLGCYVHPDGRPSDMLYDRVRGGTELYALGAAPKIIMSGDHGQDDYDEPTAMKQTALDAGVAAEDIFKDHAGFSTYESIYRAKEIFGVNKIIIVTQKYHLYRALYIAKKLGLEAYGVAADYNTYAGETSRELREVLARNKDFFKSIFKPEPTYLGDAVSVNGNGDVTN